jgi:hypothetical protein
VFNLGANGSASHGDGTSKTTYTESSNGKTLNISSGTNMYTGARDAKGNSCIKFGTGSAAGSCKIAIPTGVVKVIIEVAGYKADNATIQLGTVTKSLSNKSNNGTYDTVEVTITTQTSIDFKVTTSKRCMLNTIKFVFAN